MTILDTHWTDADIARFAQINYNELVTRVGLAQRQVIASTFFLNPPLLGCTSDSLEQGIRNKLFQILPPRVFMSMPANTPHIFRGLGDLAYNQDNQMFVVLSRPDNALTLSERISRRTDIKTDDLAIAANAPSCGFDNLELMERVYEIFNSLPNGGPDRLKALNSFDIIQYRSMLGARRQFLMKGGDKETLRLHEGASHIGAFTQGKIPQEYLGYMYDFELSEVATEVAYRDILNLLVEREYTTKETKGDKSAFAPVAIDNLPQAMGEVLDEYLNRITDLDKRKFSAFYSVVSIGAASPEEQYVVARLSSEEVIQHTKYLIVYQTLQGLRFLMGDNILKYTPQKDVASLDCVNNLLKLEY